MAEAQTGSDQQPIIVTKLKPRPTIAGGNSFFLDVLAVDLRKQSAHFAKEQPPMGLTSP